MERKIVRGAILKIIAIKMVVDEINSMSRENSLKSQDMNLEQTNKPTNIKST